MGLCAVIGKWMNEYRELVELYSRKTEVWGENSVPIPLCPLQIQYGQAWDQTWTFVVCAWCYTKSWYIVQNEDIVRLVQVMYFKNHCIIQTLAENFGILVCNCCTIVWIQRCITSTNTVYQEWWWINHVMPAWGLLVIFSIPRIAPKHPCRSWNVALHDSHPSMWKSLSLQTSMKIQQGHAKAKVMMEIFLDWQGILHQILSVLCSISRCAKEVCVSLNSCTSVAATCKHGTVTFLPSLTPVEGPSLQESCSGWSDLGNICGR